VVEWDEFDGTSAVEPDGAANVEAWRSLEADYDRLAGL
jgi:hypothetical protein